MPNLVETLPARFAEVAYFFAGGNPQAQSSFDRRAARVQEQAFARAELVQVLREYHRHLASGPQTLANVELLADERTVAVVTGQQAGFLTGPLYTLYKALTAIRLAKEQSQRLGCPVVPVFWIASEDHDWAEVQETAVLNHEGKPVACCLPGSGGGLPVGRLPVPAWREIEPVLAAALPATEYRAEILAAIAKFADQAGNLADWFALTLQWLVQDRGLVFFDPLLPGLKRLAQPVYERILRAAKEIQAALQERTARLQELGFAPQIKPTGGEVNLFLAVPKRRALLADQDGFYLRGHSGHWSWAELSSMLAAKPECFSPNVATRPVVQDFLLPTLAYVAGPGELSYWAQLGGVFEVLDRSMPVVYPRLSAVVLTPAWEKTLAAAGLTVADVEKGLAAYREQKVRELDSLDINAHFSRLRAEIRAAYAGLDPLGGLSPHVPAWIEQNLEKVESQVQYLENKIWQAQRKASEGALRHLQQLADGIAPFGKKQERVLSPLSFVARYGLDFVAAVDGLPLRPDFAQQQIRLAGLPIS